VWGDGGDPSPTGISAVLAAKRLPAAELMALAEREETAQALIAATADAAARGVFGAPTFRIGDDLFFGNDRLDFVRETLANERKGI
jgi:2-hydroxychromene-2-carboxylate isomerase